MLNIKKALITLSVALPLFAVSNISAAEMAGQASTAQQMAGPMKLEHQGLMDLIATQGVENVFVIDVRPSAAYEEDHMMNAINIDVTQEGFKDKLMMEVPDKTKHVVFYCNDPNNAMAAQAVQHAMEGGYTHLYHMVVDFSHKE